MIYFILWVVFLLTVILSVPVVSYLEKRKRLAERGPVEPEAEDAEDGDSEVVMEESGEAEFAAVDEMSGGGNDFAEFEELR